jgi:16S rRNA (cytosine1402-N4)-methyltransferase
VVTEQNKTHIPVLVNEVAELLRITKGGTFFDGTVGLGGHSAAILKASPDNFVYGSDKDSEALAIAAKNLENFSGRFSFFQADFRDLESLPLKIDKIDGFLFDLGVSSFQLDTPDRGFAYAKPAILDMRMNKAQELTAAGIINTYSYQELFDIFGKYGEFKNPARLVEQIVFHRKNKKIEKTDELKALIRRIFPRQKTMDPLPRIFQALRIEVNRELAGLEDFFSKLFHLMKPGARIAIISFHSLEDRIAKFALKQGKEKNLLKILTKKPLTAKQDEKEMNMRSRSAKLRAGEASLRHDGKI